jgi:hypothetical protein
MNKTITQFHSTWNQITGQELNLRATERLFYELWKLEFTPDDLACVLKYMLAFNRKHPECPMKVQAHKVMGDPETFASVLAEARAKERNRPRPATPKEAVLQSFRPVANAEMQGNGSAHRLSEFLKVRES